MRYLSLVRGPRSSASLFSVAVWCATIAVSANARAEDRIFPEPGQYEYVRSRSAHFEAGGVAIASPSQGWQNGFVLEAGWTTRLTRRDQGFLPALFSRESDTFKLRAVVIPFNADGSTPDALSIVPQIRALYEHESGGGGSTIARPESEQVEWKPINLVYGVGGERNVPMDRAWNGSGWIGFSSGFKGGPNEFTVALLGEAGVGDSSGRIIPYAMVVIRSSTTLCGYISENLKHSLCAEGAIALKGGALQAEGEFTAKAYYKYTLNTTDRVGQHVVNNITVGPQFHIAGRKDWAGNHGELDAFFGLTIK